MSVYQGNSGHQISQSLHLGGQTTAAAESGKCGLNLERSLDFGGEYKQQDIILVIFPLIILGFNNPHTTSNPMGIGTFSFVIEKLSNLTAIAAPPPLFVPGRGVLIY